jgi:hypothetical protein
MSRKTTTMLFKMLGIEHSWQQHRELRAERPRQLFVTQSRMLADKVEEYFIKLLQSLVLSSQTDSSLSDLLERQRNREEAGLVDQDEAVNWRDDLPRRFSELQDSHFPMFVTFDKVQTTSLIGCSLRWYLYPQLSAMIEADIGHPTETTVEGLGAGQQVVSSEYMLQRRKSFISFDVFREKYWGHFPQPLTKGLGSVHVSVIEDVFMSQLFRRLTCIQRVHGWLRHHSYRNYLIVDSPSGVIKGSETTLTSEKHFLDYDTYLNLSVRTQATFASKRKEIYSLFEAYMKMKRDRKEYDAADR